MPSIRRSRSAGRRRVYYSPAGRVEHADAATYLYTRGPMKRKFKVEVDVNSFSPPRVYLGSYRLTLGGGSPRKGSHAAEITGSTLRARLRFSAPAQTAWSFKVMEERKGANGATTEVTLLDESDSSDRVDFDYSETLNLPA